MTVEEIKAEIIKDYRDWVELNFIGCLDQIGLACVAVENFELKLDKLIKTIQDGNNT